MIVDTMTLDEIRHELKKDYAAFSNMENEIVARDIKNRVWDRVKVYPHGYIRDLKSRRQNRYLLLVVADSHKSTKRICDLVGFPIAIHHHGKKGLYAYQWSDENPGSLTVMHPHYFHRYAERMKLEEKDPVEIVKHYLLHNLKCLGTKGYYKNRVYTAGAMSEGVSLGITKGNVEHLLTFVSYDMLFDEQKEYKDAMVQPILDCLKLSSSCRSLHKFEQAKDEFLALSEKNRETYMNFWKGFAKHHLHRDVDVVQRDEGEYDLVEKEKTEVDKIIQKNEHARLMNEELMSPEEERIARLENLVRKFRKYDQERKEYYAAVLKENEELKVRIAELEAQLKGIPSGEVFYCLEMPKNAR